MRSDHKALLFLAAIAGIGATVRVARATGTPKPSASAALEHQMQAADSARRNMGGKRSDKGRRQQPKNPSASRVAGVAQQPSASVAKSEHRDYKGRLDLDLATATEIDSLPGMGPSMAKRIVADRMKNGAFRELIALRRVKGMSPRVLSGLDSLVSFSGAYKPPLPSDTVIAAKASKKRH